MSFFKRTAASAAALSLLLLAPISFQPSSLLADGPGALVKLNDACGQATSCRAATSYICSTSHQDHMNYACYTGCQIEPQ